MPEQPEPLSQQEPAADPPRRGPGRPRGRRAGTAQTREQILAAAREQFAALGYERATVRSVARAAGVDPALVHHYFGTKREVFVAATDFPIDPAQVLPVVLAGDPDQIALRLLRTLFSVWEEPVTRQRALALLRSAFATEAGAELLEGFFSREIVDRVATVLGRPDARLRATLVASQLIGMIAVRYLLRVEPLASEPIERLITCYAPTVQRYLTGELD